MPVVARRGAGVVPSTRTRNVPTTASTVNPGAIGKILPLAASVVMVTLIGWQIGSLFPVTSAPKGGHRQIKENLRKAQNQQVGTTPDPLLTEKLPVGWEVAKDPSSGFIYYFHRGTGTRQWIHPDPARAAEIAKAKEAAKVAAKSTTASAPTAAATQAPKVQAQTPEAKKQDGDTSLPVGWESAKDPGSGLTYYFHRGTGTRQWEHPGGTGNAPASKSPASISAKVESKTTEAPKKDVEKSASGKDNTQKEKKGGAFCKRWKQKSQVAWSEVRRPACCPPQCVMPRCRPCDSQQCKAQTPEPPECAEWAADNEVLGYGHEKKSESPKISKSQPKPGPVSVSLPKSFPGPISNKGPRSLPGKLNSKGQVTKKKNDGDKGKDKAKDEVMDDAESPTSPPAQGDSQGLPGGASQGLPEGWESAKDPKSGFVYYFHRNSGTRQWEHPTLTPGQAKSDPTSAPAIAPPALTPAPTPPPKPPPTPAPAPLPSPTPAPSPAPPIVTTPPPHGQWVFVPHEHIPVAGGVVTITFTTTTTTTTEKGQWLWMPAAGSKDMSNGQWIWLPEHRAAAILAPPAPALTAAAPTPPPLPVPSSPVSDAVDHHTGRDENGSHADHHVGHDHVDQHSPAHSEDHDAGPDDHGKHADHSGHLEHKDQHDDRTTTLIHPFDTSTTTFVAINGVQSSQLSSTKTLPVGWETAKDAVSGLTYYFNRKTGVRQWEVPDP